MLFERINNQILFEKIMKHFIFNNMPADGLAPY